MAETQLKVLLVEDNPADARYIRELLSDYPGKFLVENVVTLEQTLLRLPQKQIDVIMLDLFLPDSKGMDTFKVVHDKQPEIPIVVMTGMSDETYALEAVQNGAQDYLVKGQTDAPLLNRALRYAIERHRLQEELRALSLEDELTGLYNRRGFLTIARQQLKSARRMGRNMSLLFADVDNLKLVNDYFGHSEGDRLLMEIADILRAAFRESDVIARLGGDEFAVFAEETQDSPSSGLTLRMTHELERRNAIPGRRYRLSACVGAAYYKAGDETSIEDLLSKADADMYKQKHLRRGNNILQ